MAVLQHEESKAAHQLGARTIVGRSAVCQLCLSSPSVSGVHAELCWIGGRWQIQDLGSRNGTFVDDRKLGPGERVTLEVGARVTFGEREHDYRLVDATGPKLCASSDRGELVLGESGLLCLPSVDACEATVFEGSAGSWVLETEAETRPIEDQAAVVADGRVWRVTLPAPAIETRELGAGEQAEPSLDALTLELFVSRDREHLGVKVVQETWSRALDERAHLFLLLALARARLADRAQAHLPESEHGWAYRDELADSLGIDGPLLNLWIHRARRQFAELGIHGAGNLIERRGATQQLRLGVTRLIIHDA